MKDRTWIGWLLFSVSGLIAGGYAVALGCGYYGGPDLDAESFFDTAIIDNLAGAAPSHPRQVEPRWGERPDPERPGDRNVDEWMAHFGGKVERGDLVALLYQTKIPRIDRLIVHLKEGGEWPPPEFAGSSLLKTSDNASVIQALYYLGYALRVEPLATREPPGWRWEKPGESAAPADPDADSRLLRKLISGGERGVSNAKSSFLRKRYVFQLLKARYYAKDYPGALGWYEANRKELSDNSSIHWRSMGYAAGSLYKLRRYSEANYLYSLIYDRYPPMRETAYLSFHPQEEADWRGCLAMAKGPREKAVLWQMLGIYADGLRAMKEIHAIDPKSDLLPELLVREVDRSRRGRSDSSDEDGPPVPRKVDDGLIEFVDKVANAEKTGTPWLWHLAAAHLYAIDANRGNAMKHLRAAERRAPGTPAVRNQIRITGLLAEISALREPNASLESMLGSELAKLREVRGPAQLFLAWAAKTLSGIYLGAGDEVVARCLVDEGRDAFYYENRNIDRMLAYVDKPKTSPFEAWVSSVYPYTPGELKGLKAINLMYAGDIAGAARMFQAVEDGGGELAADPFVIHIRDCHDCDADDKNRGVWTKAAFARRMSELLQQARKNPSSSAALYFELANGLYNITYFGNCRSFYDTRNANFYGDRRHYNAELAQTYYRKAMELSTDREFKAKACFMAAKCEESGRYPKEFKIDAFEPGKNYLLLKTAYADTNYYKEILRECSYFRMYVRKSATR